MIPFRRQRLATSVVNRIMNMADGLAPAEALGAPAAPDTTGPQAELAANVTAPKAPVDAPQETAEAIALAPLV